MYNVRSYDCYGLTAHIHIASYVGVAPGEKRERRVEAVRLRRLLGPQRGLHTGQDGLHQTANVSL